MHSNRWRIIVGLLISLAIGQSVLYSQVQVHEESYHRLVLENDQCRILQVELDPGDTSAFHIHDQPIAYASRNGSLILLQDQEGDQKVVELSDDWVGSDVYHQDEPFIHRIVNIGHHPFQLLAIESKANVPQLTDKGLKDEWLLTENDYFQIGRIVVPPASSLDFEPAIGTVIMLQRGDSVEYTTDCLQLLNDEHWWFIQEENTNLHLANPGKEDIELVIIQVN